MPVLDLLRPDRGTYSVIITKPGYINLDRRFIRKYGVKEGMAAELDWWASDDTISVDLLPEAFDLESMSIIMASNGRTAYIDARRFFHNVNLGSNINIPLALQFRLSDPSADAFVLHLDESPTPAV
jgi:hypothetical protein